MVVQNDIGCVQLIAHSPQHTVPYLGCGKYQKADTEL
jgi:hypothetical protein